MKVLLHRIIKVKIAIVILATAIPTTTALCFVSDFCNGAGNVAICHWKGNKGFITKCIPSTNADALARFMDDPTSTCDVCTMEQDNVKNTCRLNNQVCIKNEDCCSNTCHPKKGLCIGALADIHNPAKQKCKNVVCSPVHSICDVNEGGCACEIGFMDDHEGNCVPNMCLEKCPSKMAYQSKDCGGAECDQATGCREICGEDEFFNVETWDCAEILWN